jgi:antitoxin HicB
LRPRERDLAKGEVVEATFTALLVPDEEEGGYVVSFPAIPDLATQGETVEEARAMAEECLRGYLGVLKDKGRPLPKEKRSSSGEGRGLESKITV